MKMFLIIILHFVISLNMSTFILDFLHFSSHFQMFYLLIYSFICFSSYPHIFSFTCYIYSHSYFHIYLFVFLLKLLGLHGSDTVSLHVHVTINRLYINSS